ncbi:MAG: flavin reductase family protein, partial [Rhodobacteraceae bacterium]|nr:flavin reductase family protein [Paracoccaceae bacterium]
VKDEVLTPEGKLDYAAIRPLARVGSHDYTSFSETFTMPIPGATGAAAAGLEGKA